MAITVHPVCAATGTLCSPPRFPLQQTGVYCRRVAWWFGRAEPWFSQNRSFSSTYWLQCRRRTGNAWARKLHFFGFSFCPLTVGSVIIEAKGPHCEWKTLLQDLLSLVGYDAAGHAFPSTCSLRKPITRAADAAGGALRGPGRTSRMSQDPQSESRSWGPS